MSLSTCGTMTGFTFAHGTLADVTSPAGIPAHLAALDQPAGPASSRAASASGKDSALRSAIVSVARHYLQMARTRTPAEMEALIWQASSADGADHGPSCAAFASLTLALGARAAGQQSWVSGGGSYPWPLHLWADVRVQPNPASPDVVSMLQDAQAHHRWHPLGDGYRPRPGDWVLFDGHVEVVTRHADAAIYTVGADSLPGLTVNAHRFPAPFGAQGVLGFVNNGELADAAARAGGGGGGGGGGTPLAAAAAQVPGLLSPTAGATAQTAGTAPRADHAPAASPAAVIPGVLADSPGAASAGSHAPAYRRHDQAPAGLPGTAAQQAFIRRVAPAAVAAEQQYGVPASVTIAQAIDESGWGHSELATEDHNLFGIKGAGPAGRHMRLTREFENGAWVTRTAPFRVYHDVAESVSDHGRLLATGPAYQHAMAVRHRPDAFATSLTGVYATDPDYGSHLIALMRRYHLYRFDAATAPASPQSAAGGAAGSARSPGAGSSGAGSSGAASIPGVAGALAAGAVRRGPRIAPRGSPTSTRRYVSQIPPAVAAGFVATAKGPLTRGRPLYQDVADHAGIGWELLAACDWMQCQALPRYSPVHGEKLGTVNPDGMVFRTRSEALAQCAADLVDLAGAVYLIDLPARRALSVRELANVFAAFRWGGLLQAHGVSAMEFPYSVAGLTYQHLKMRWPDIDDSYAPDKPGARFRPRFGAVPVVLSLGYRALA